MQRHGARGEGLAEIHDAVGALRFGVVAGEEVSGGELADAEEGDVLRFELCAVLALRTRTRVFFVGGDEFFERHRTGIARTPELLGQRRVGGVGVEDVAAVGAPRLESGVGQLQSRFGGEFPHVAEVRVGEGLQFVGRFGVEAGEFRAEGSALDLDVGYREPLRVALAAVDEAHFGVAQTVGREPCDARPCVALRDAHRDVGRHDAEPPLLRAAVCGDIHQPYRLERGRSLDFGRVGRDSGRAEFELLDRDVLQVGAARDVGRRRAVRRIDLGRAHLLLHAEIAFDGLRGRDAPPVLLIERQRRVERRAQVERAGEGYRRLPAFGERHRGDVHVADVGGLQKRQDDGLLRSVDLGCAVEPFGLDRLDVDRHHGVGQVVMDAAGEERRKAQCAEKDESFHGYSFFLFHK